MVKWSWFIFSHDLDLVKTANWVRDRAMMFNATFNNISGISWRSVLLAEESRHATNHL